MEDTDGKSSSNREKIIICLMIISAFIGIYHAIDSWLQLRDEEWRTNQTEARTAMIEKLATDADSHYFITSKLLPLLRIIPERPEVDINAIRSKYLKQYDLDLFIYKFAPNGKLESAAPSRAPNQWLMKNLYPLLTETDLKKIATARREMDKKIEFAFGYGKDLVSIRDNPEVIINTVTSGQESFCAWTNRASGGVIIWCSRLPNPDIVLKNACSKFSNDKTLLFSNKLTNSKDSGEAIEANLVYSNFSKNLIEHGVYFGKEWYFIAKQNSEKYYMAFSNNASVFSRAHIFLKIMFMILVPLTLIVIINQSSASIFNLKKLVILIFLASSILPLAAIGAVSLESLDTYAQINKLELKSSVEEAIGNIIQNFHNYLTTCTNRILSLVSPEEDGSYNFNSITERVIEEFPNAKLTARNISSELVATNFPNYKSGQEAIFKSLFHVYAKKYMAERLVDSSYNGNPFADVLVEMDDFGFSAMTNSPDELQFVKSGGSKILMFAKLLPPEAGDMAFITVQPDLAATMKDYTRSIDPRTLVSNHQQIKLTAFNPLRYRWAISPESSTQALFEQARAAYVIGKPIFRRITENGKNVYSLCIPNSDIDDICYIGTLSFEEQEKQITKQKYYITGSAILAIILLFAIISWLMKQLIAPLVNLEFGIKALAERKFETQIPIPAGNDELVQLFKEFNYMMGESYDMQIAKNVQEGLITQTFPQTDDYKISGISVPANDLGGDCLTSMALSDGRILFLVGDLTGHSIGSALMMAFVRSVCFNWSQRNEYDPEILADDIDKMLRNNQIERMFMGIICGVLNPENGIIKFVTRGHIYPLFLRNDGTSEWLGKPALPLGIGKEKPSKVLKTRLLPGERMLCISDGIIEIASGSGFTTGYETVEKWAMQNIKEEGQMWLKSIHNEFVNWCNERKIHQTDDLTLFTIIANNQIGVSEYE